MPKAKSFFYLAATIMSGVLIWLLSLYTPRFGLGAIVFIPLYFALFLIGVTMLGLFVVSLITGLSSSPGKPVPLLSLSISLICLIGSCLSYYGFLHLPFGVPLVLLVIFIILFIGGVVDMTRK